MTAVLDAEVARLAEQQRLDRLKTVRDRNKWGQFATPPTLALDIAACAWQNLKMRKTDFRFLDPAIGTGSFYAAFLQTFPKKRIEAATGVELDRLFADSARAIWRHQGLQVILGDFTRQTPDAHYNVVLANPPYVRHHHISPDEKKRLAALAESTTGVKLSGLAGLYAYFLLIAHAWLEKNGLAIWLIPSEFMDVNYGEGVKRYLTDCVSLRQIHRFCPSDVQFNDALVSSAIVIFENRRPAADHRVNFSFGGGLLEPRESKNVSLEQLRTTRKWTVLSTRIPICHAEEPAALGDYFTIKRGLATGNNQFFIVPRNNLDELGIPSACVRPILPSPRYLHQEIIEADSDGWPLLDRQLALVDCNYTEEAIRKKWPRFAEYLETGRLQGVPDGYLASRRIPWYSQEKRDAAPFICTYMGRTEQRPFRFMLNRSKATAANVYHLLYPKADLSAIMAGKSEEILRALQAIRPEQFLYQGRVYGGGLYKIEPAEMMRLPVPSLAGILGINHQRQQSLFKK